jgi:UDP-N-acetylmuramoylalanine--D-glutamate ligase
VTVLSPLARFRRALIVGCGQSGVSAALVLQAAGCEVRLFDRRVDLAGLPSALDGCARFLGTELAPDAAFAGIDLLLLSPGVPPARWL